VQYYSSDFGLFTAVIAVSYLLPSVLAFQYRVWLNSVQHLPTASSHPGGSTGIQCRRGWRCFEHSAGLPGSHYHGHASLIRNGFAATDMRTRHEINCYGCLDPRRQEDQGRRGVLVWSDDDAEDDRPIEFDVISCQAILSSTVNSRHYQYSLRWSASAHRLRSVNNYDGLSAPRREFTWLKPAAIHVQVHIRCDFKFKVYRYRTKFNSFKLTARWNLGDTGIYDCKI